MAPIQFIFGYSYSHNTHNLPQNTCVWANLTFSFFAALILFFPSVRMQTPLTMLQVIHPPPPPQNKYCMHSMPMFSLHMSWHIRHAWNVFVITMNLRKAFAEIYVIYRPRVGPYAEKLWPRSSKNAARGPTEVTRQHFQDQGHSFSPYGPSLTR